ncbi:MAG: hypothetical protein K0Q51_70 [Rickettsiaceae bacterium]|jgi:zinc transport system substrate-binding protein|nr:hypothetical protein [Rickettsiaceae bacterium]
MIKYFLKICLISITFATSSIAGAEKIKIVTLLSPIASLASMIAKERVDIEIISNGNACVHHHHLKPSQLKAIESADIIIAVAPKFDGKLITKLLTAPEKILYLNEDRRNFEDYHLWLNIEQATLMLREIHNALTNIMPENEAYFKQNLESSIKELYKLKMVFNQADIDNVLSVSSNLSSFFDNYPKPPATHYITQESLKFSDIDQLLKRIKEKNYKCLITDEEQSSKRLHNLFKGSVNIVQLNAEHWERPKTKHLSDLYSFYFKENLSKLTACK